MNRIVILGSTGFLGKKLRISLDRTNFPVKYMIHNKNKKLKKNEFYGDILDIKTLSKNLSDGDIVINLVGQYEKNFLNFFNSNLIGSLNLLEIAKKKKNLKIIFASSINVYGTNCKNSSKEIDIPKPSTNYGIVKHLTEQLYERFSNLNDLKIIILRFSNLYGPNKKSGLIFNLINSKKQAPIIIDNNGLQTRDFLFVDDAVSAIISSIYFKQNNFEIFNISSGKKLSPKNLIQFIEKNSEKKIFYKFLKENTSEMCNWANNNKAKKLLNFKPKFELNSELLKIL